MYENFRVFETEFAGRPLKVETGKMGLLANGSCLIRYGETSVFCAATASAKPRDGIDFLPLSVDFEEKLYSVGRIPGSFTRREGKPTDKAILASRVIDRPVRPLFPKDMRNDVSLVCTVMSVDPDCSPEITAMIGASIALSISDIPWEGPISGISVGFVDGEIVLNPTAEQQERNELQLTVASTADLVAMIEAGAKEIPDDTMFDAIMKGHEENQKIVSFINSIAAEYPSAPLLPRPARITIWPPTSIRSLTAFATARPARRISSSIGRPSVFFAYASISDICDEVTSFIFLPFFVGFEQKFSF